MNDYTKLIAHAAAKFTGKPAVLSPLLDSYCGWENKKNRFSSEPTKEDFRVILSAGGLSFEELDIDVEIDEKQEKFWKKKFQEYEGRLKICMQHGSKTLGENNFNWSRDCTYEYAISPTIAPVIHNLAVYWTNDDFLIIQARNLENPLAKEAKVDYEHLLKFRLIPTEVIDILEPALNVPFLKQLLNAIKKKASDVSSYVGAATEIPEVNDVLSLLKCIPLSKKMDFKQMHAEATAEQSSQDDSGAETSQTDSKDSKSKSAKSKKTVTTKSKKV